MKIRMVRFLGISLVLISFLNQSLAGINIHTRFITPRLHLLEPTTDSLSSQSAYYQLELDFSHAWSPQFKVAGDLEFGPRDFVFSEQARVKQLFFKYTRPDVALQVGRFPFWNVLLPLRIDGLLFKLNRWGRWTVLGGYPVFYRRPTSNYVTWFIQWAMLPQLKVAYWQTAINEQTQSLVGLGVRQLWPGSWLTSGEFSWNLTQQQVDRIRVFVSKRLKGSELLFSFRKVGQSMALYYPWLEEVLSPPPLASVYWSSHSLLRPTLSLGYRFSVLDSWFSTISIGRQTRVAVGLYQHAGRQWLTGSLITSRRWRQLSFNLRLTANGVEYFGDIEPAEAWSVSAWLNWQPFTNVHLQINGSLVQNPFYRQDGRMGVDFSYEL